MLPMLQSLTKTCKKAPFARDKSLAEAQIGYPVFTVLPSACLITARIECFLTRAWKRMRRELETLDAGLAPMHIRGHDTA